MRALLLVPVLLALPVCAHAEPAQEARSATAACLSAIIDNAPVEDIDGDDVTIRRGKDPVSCTVRVTAGEPVLIRDAVMVALKRRAEIFSPAKTRWEPGRWASRETFCNLPGRRAVAAFLSTSKPGLQPVATVTVFETKERDQRCDRDAGVQTVAAAEAPPPPTALAAEEKTAPEPTLLPIAPKAEKPKKGLRERLGLGKKD
ncbi:MAG: hypothetical protein JNL41_13290 [Phenylobacterium sp.]|uniref:hypothetical protein n=1 Tax=Phenylobacterium sp. TaxID=1871053 RepID=UPI001A4FC007|nr:hypothetical protein [Phenylobacterium sp.]MBL8555250.1 hypothetical protein [Phenylobacterium sp.]